MEPPKSFGAKNITKREIESAVQVTVARVLSSGSPELIGYALERLSNGVGFMIANMSDGDGKHIDELITGVEGYIHEAATSHAPMATRLSSLLGRLNK